MKKWVLLPLILLLLVCGFFVVDNHRLKVKQRELNHKIETLVARDPSEDSRIQGPSAPGAIQQTAPDQQAQMTQAPQNEAQPEPTIDPAETAARLQELRQRRTNLQTALDQMTADPRLRDIEGTLQDRRSQIQQLQSQLFNVHGSALGLEHAKNQSMAAQRSDQVNRLTTINDQITSLQSAIAANENQISVWRQSDSDMRDQSVAMLGATINDQKKAIAELESQRQMILQGQQAQMAQMQAQANTEQSSLQLNQREIEAQIASLQTEVQALETQRLGLIQQQKKIQDQILQTDQEISRFSQ